MLNLWIKFNVEYVDKSGLLLLFLKRGREGFLAVVLDDLPDSGHRKIALYPSLEKGEELLPQHQRDRVPSPAQLRKFLLKKSTVRCHASFAAFSSYLGVVSVLKPCCVPAYLNISYFTPAAFNTVS